MIVQLEGLDKQGKSTLAEKIVKKFGFELVKFSAPKCNAYEEYSRFLDKADPKKDYVLDRFCLGELAYGPVLRGSSQITCEDLRYLELRLRSHWVISIFCYTDINHASQNMIKCNEETTKQGHIVPIFENFYETIINSSCLLWDWYDYRTDNITSIYLKINQFLNFRRINKKQIKNWLGTPTPRVIFVLDEKNPNLKHKHILDSTSGRYLINVLWMQNYEITGYAFTNSDDVDFNLLKQSKVICLGTKAAERLGPFFEFKTGKHPQYAKRFYGKNSIERYSNELSKLL